MNKVELEARVDALMDEINFMKMFFEAVRNAPYLGPRDMATGASPEIRGSRIDFSGSYAVDTSLSLLPPWNYSHFVTYEANPLKKESQI